jgi:HAD superfamily hydrolase (TIGR01549 family)
MVKKLSGMTFDFDATFYNYPRMVAKLFHRYGPHTKLIYDLTKERKKLRSEGKIENFRERQVEVMAKRWKKTPEWTRNHIDRVVYNGFNSSFDRIKPLKNSFEMLDMVVANGIPVCVVSDYPPHDKMTKMGFMRYQWAAVINGEDIGQLKPHPAGLQAAMAKMGTKPEETLHVGDSVGFDVRGAKNAGMMSAWLKWWWRRNKYDIQPDYTFSNFNELMDILEKEFGLVRKKN